MELLAAGDRIDVVQIKPSGIASALPHHARNHLAAEPRVMPPLYAPELVAASICDALARPVREITIGIPGGLLRLGMALAPALTDRVIAAVVPPITHSRRPVTPTDNLDRPTEGGRIHSPYTSGIPISPTPRCSRIAQRSRSPACRSGRSGFSPGGGADTAGAFIFEPETKAGRQPQSSPDCFLALSSRPSRASHRTRSPEPSEGWNSS